MTAIHERRTERLSTSRLVAVLGAVLATAGLAACSSSGTPKSGPATSTAPTGQRQPGTGGGAGGGSGAGFAGLAASGSIAAVASASIEVQNQTTGQVTVGFTAKTAFTQTTATTLAAVTVGSCVTAAAAQPPATTSPSGAPSTPPASAPAVPSAITASTVLISPATNGQCSAFGGSGRGRPGGTRSGFPTGARTGTRPSAAPGAGRAFGERASGKVTAVSGSTISVQVIDPSTKATTTAAVTVTASTKYTHTVAATKSALRVGLCASAIGPTSTTGQVAATRIALSSAGATGCSTGFGGPGGRRGGSAPASGTNG